MSFSAGLLVGFSFLVCGFGQGTELAVGEPAWEDLSQLPRLTVGARSRLSSSYCLDGCRFDRHSRDDHRFVRMTGEEGVIFEALGPGAITRIWMTMGSGIAQPLDPDISVRLTIDGQVRLDMPLPDFFSGTNPPFLAPLVGNLASSAGGNFCLLPLTYRESCRLSLIGAEGKRIWYQVHHLDLIDNGVIESFDPQDDTAYWRGLLSLNGSDPWSAEPARLIEGQAVVPAGGSVFLFQESGPNTVAGLLLDLPQSAWPDLALRIRCDGRVRVFQNVAEFFSLRVGQAQPNRSLLLGQNPNGLLYCYFPMPYFEGMSIELVDQGGLGMALEVPFRVRIQDRAPASDSGYFTTQTQAVDHTLGEGGVTLFEVAGHGKWVGLDLRLGSVNSTSLAILEGDERVFVDGSAVPAWEGTGVEDFFGGGFYFRDPVGQPTPFSLALHGMVDHAFDGLGQRLDMYRLLIADAVPFAKSIRAFLEAGPTGEMDMRAQSTAYFYLRDETDLASPGLNGVVRDRLPPPGDSLLVQIADPLFAAFLIEGSWFDPVTGAAFAIDRNGDGQIQVAEALDLTGVLDVSRRGIASLAGIEAFANLSGLISVGNPLLELDLKGMARLGEIVLDGNLTLEGVTLANLSGLKSLRLLHSPALSALNLTDCPMLVNMDLLDLPALTTLDFGALASLTKLAVAFCAPAQLDLSPLTELRVLDLAQNPGLQRLTLPKLGALETLRLLGNPALTEVSATQLAFLRFLEIAENKSLRRVTLEDLDELLAVRLQHNPMLSFAALDNLANLRVLDAAVNGLAVVSLSECPAIEALNLRGNQLSTTGILADLAKLEWADLRGNQLAQLGSLPTGLRSLNASDNQLFQLPDHGALTLPVYLRYDANLISDATELASAMTLGIMAEQTLNLDSNCLNWNDCGDLEVIQERFESAGALFIYSDQGSSADLWPQRDVRTLIAHPHLTLQCMTLALGKLPARTPFWGPPR